MLAATQAKLMAMIACTPRGQESLKCEPADEGCECEQGDAGQAKEWDWESKPGFEYRRGARHQGAVAPLMRESVKRIRRTNDVDRVCVMGR